MYTIPFLVRKVTPLPFPLGTKLTISLSPEGILPLMLESKYLNSISCIKQILGLGAHWIQKLIQKEVLCRFLFCVKLTTQVLVSSCHWGLGIKEVQASWPTISGNVLIVVRPLEHTHSFKSKGPISRICLDGTLQRSCKSPWGLGSTCAIRGPVPCWLANWSVFKQK